MYGCGRGRGLGLGSRGSARRSCKKAAVAIPHAIVVAALDVVTAPVDWDAPTAASD